MPTYGWLYQNDLDTSVVGRKMEIMSRIGVPYTVDDVARGKDNLLAQAKQIADELVSQGVKDSGGLEKKEIIALIAYLQRLGKDAKEAQ